MITYSGRLLSSVLQVIVKGGGCCNFGAILFAENNILQLYAISGQDTGSWPKDCNTVSTYPGMAHCLARVAKVIERSALCGVSLYTGHLELRVLFLRSNGTHHSDSEVRCGALL